MFKFFLIHLMFATSEYSEDIYPYATFQLGDQRHEDAATTAKFQTFVFQDSRYGVTEGRPPPPSVSCIICYL